MDKLVAEGETALFKAANVALDDLRYRKGNKRLVLFTDGMDTAGGVTLNDIILRCQKESVSVFSIGLKGEDLDAGTLKRLAEETGGAYAEAAGQQDLAEKFRLTSRRVSKQFYRLAVTPPEEAISENMLLDVRVGGENAARFSVRVQGR